MRDLNFYFCFYYFVSGSIPDLLWNVTLVFLHSFRWGGKSNGTVCLRALIAFACLSFCRHLHSSALCGRWCDHYMGRTTIPNGPDGPFTIGWKRMTFHWLKRIWPPAPVTSPGGIVRWTITASSAFSSISMRMKKSWIGSECTAESGCRQASLASGKCYNHNERQLIQK